MRPSKKKKNELVLRAGKLPPSPKRNRVHQDKKKYNRKKRVEMTISEFMKLGSTRFACMNTLHI